jgi:hypothetical protein
MPLHAERHFAVLGGFWEIAADNCTKNSAKFILSTINMLHKSINML